MAKKDMKRPDQTPTPRNDTAPVPQIQGKARNGKEQANPIITEATGPELKVFHAPSNAQTQKR